jgi:hypothetical protein
MEKESPCLLRAFRKAAKWYRSDDACEERWRLAWSAIRLVTLGKELSLGKACQRASWEALRDRWKQMNLPPLGEKCLGIARREIPKTAAHVQQLVERWVESTH